MAPCSSLLLVWLCIIEFGNNGEQDDRQYDLVEMADETILYNDVLSFKVEKIL